MHIGPPALPEAPEPGMLTDNAVVIELISSRRNGDEGQRTLPLWSDQLRGRNRRESGQDLSLYRLSDPHRHRLSYHGAELAGHFRSKERNTEDLHQDR